MRMYADHREDITEVRAGDIAAVLGFKETFTGDTLCDNKMVVLETITFPSRSSHVAIEPKTTADQEKMGEALRKLSEEDPTFRVHSDENTGQTIIAGMGELHLEVIVDRMMREFHVQANVGKPRVAYRESITGRSRKSITSTSSRRAATASMVMWSSRWNRVSAAVASSSRIKSLVAQSHVSIFRRWKKASRKPLKAACWPDTRWLI